MVLGSVKILAQTSAAPSDTLLKRSQIYIRDPFILPDVQTKTYYMFSSAIKSAYLPEAVNGVVVYKSEDLENWTRPTYVFRTPPDWWASEKHGVWAPEVHRYRGKYYLFATFSNPEKKVAAQNPQAKSSVRGTAILVADTPDGEYKPLSDNSMTPPEWMALDGTLFVEDGKPQMVFCHEWIQVGDGTMERVALKKDLSGTVGEPETMFRATDAPWVKSIEGKNWNTSGYITDGPWFYRTKGGKLLMLWSSFGDTGYSVGVAESSNGKLTGQWTQRPRLFEKDGGHAMVFQTFDGRMILTLHQPNSGDIRVRFFELAEVDNTLKIKKIIPFE